MVSPDYARAPAGFSGWPWLALLVDGLEAEASRQCYVPGLNLCALDRSECRGGLRAGGEVPGQRPVRLARVEVVKRIEGFDAEFERLAFGDAGRLGQGQIHRPQPRSVEEGRRRIAEAQRVRAW